MVKELKGSEHRNNSNIGNNYLGDFWVNGIYLGK